MPEIFLHLDGQQAGPYSPTQLRQFLAEGKAAATTPAWHQGLSEWSTVTAVLAAFPLEEQAPGSLPPLPPPPAKKGLSGCALAAIIVGIVGFVGIFVLSCLAGIAIGPITNGIKKAKENASMQSTRAISLAMFAYANDHDGNYPAGNTSTEVFQKLLDEQYVGDPSVFYVEMPGKTKPTSSKLVPENVCYDVTSGVTSKSSDLVPLIFSTGYVLTYSAGSVATPDPTAKAAYPGIAVAYKNNTARFCNALPNGTVPSVVPDKFDAGDITYRQLKP